MKTMLNSSNNVLLAASLLFLCVFTSCESSHELPLVIPQVDNSEQYIDMYCGQNSTSFVACFGVQSSEEWSPRTGGPLLQNGKMDCFLFRIHDNDSIYDGMLDLSMQHRVNWQDTWENDGVYITTYKNQPGDPADEGWSKEVMNNSLDHYLATNQDQNGMFFSSNYQSVPIESIQGKLNMADQGILDKYLMQVEEGHVRVFVFNVSDSYLSTLETLKK